MKIWMLGGLCLLLTFAFPALAGQDAPEPRGSRGHVLVALESVTWTPGEQTLLIVTREQDAKDNKPVGEIERREYRIRLDRQAPHMAAEGKSLPFDNPYEATLVVRNLRVLEAYLGDSVVWWKQGTAPVPARNANSVATR